MPAGRLCLSCPNRISWWSALQRPEGFGARPQRSGWGTELVPVTWMMMVSNRGPGDRTRLLALVLNLELDGDVGDAE